MTALVPLLLLAADPPAFAAVGAGDERPVGPVLRLSADGRAEVGIPGGTAAVPQLVSLRRVGVAVPAVPRGPALLTTTGDRVPGRLTGGDARSLRFRPPFLPETATDWPVPLASVAVVWLARPPADTPLDPARYPWLADHRRRDLVLLRNGDVARGTLTGFAPDIRLKPEGGPVRTFPPTEPAALAFDPSLARTRKPTGPYSHVVLRDGTRLDLTAAAIEANVLRGKANFGLDVQLPTAELVALDVYQGKAVYLSDLTPARAEHAGFLGPVWPWAADRSVRHEPLVLTGPNGPETFDRGIGTHPRTVLAYDLGGKYRRFEAVVGLDAESGRGGQAVVRILLDGKDATPVGLRRLVSGPAVPVRLDVTGAKELVLEVDFGPAGDVRADVDWGDARLFV